MTVFSTIVAFVFWARGVELIGPNRAGVFLHLIPIYSALLTGALLGEPLRSYHVVGFVLILPACGALADRVEQLREQLDQARAEALQDRDDRDRDAGADQAILDRRRAGLVFEKTPERLKHPIPFLLVIGVMPDEAFHRGQPER